MDDLRSRAAALLRGSHPLSRTEAGGAVGLIERYVNGKLWNDPGLWEQLYSCIRRAQARAAGPTKPTGPARDEQTFYRRAATILQEIEAVVSAGRVEPNNAP